MNKPLKEQIDEAREAMRKLIKEVQPIHQKEYEKQMKEIANEQRG